MKKIVLAACVVALLATSPASAQLDLTRYVALGDSLTAGFTSGGLVDCYQLHSYPAWLAAQAGAPALEMPLLSPPGIPPTLILTSLEGGVPTLVPAGNPADAFPYNAEYPLPYSNLGVPGATVYNMATTTGDINNLLAGNTDNVMHDLILRVPQVLDPSSGEVVNFTAVVQAIAQDPTFITLWIGNNDVLQGVTSGTPIVGLTMTPVDFFADLYAGAVAELVDRTGADIVLFTLPDVTEIPFMTTVPPFLDLSALGFGVVPIMGSNGPLPPNARVSLLASSLLAQGYGLPLPGYPPLPEDVNPATGEPGYVLRPEEIATVKNHVAALNAVIIETADAFGLPVFDAGAVIDRATFGEGYAFGGVHLDASFLTGGFGSYDGVHPQQLGYAIIATELIDFLNDAYQADIPQIDMTGILFDNPCAPLPSPFGVVPESVVFSPEARDAFLDLFMPDLTHRAPRDQRATAVAD